MTSYARTYPVTRSKRQLVVKHILSTPPHEKGAGRSRRPRISQLVFDVLHEPLCAGVLELRLRDVPAPILPEMISLSRPSCCQKQNKVYEGNAVLARRRRGGLNRRVMVQR